MREKSTSTRKKGNDWWRWFWPRLRFFVDRWRVGHGTGVQQTQIFRNPLCPHPLASISVLCSACAGYSKRVVHSSRFFPLSWSPNSARVHFCVSVSRKATRETVYWFGMVGISGRVGDSTLTLIHGDVHGWWHMVFFPADTQINSGPFRWPMNGRRPPIAGRRLAFYDALEHLEVAKPIRSSPLASDGRRWVALSSRQSPHTHTHTHTQIKTNKLEKRPVSTVVALGRVLIKLDLARSSITRCA